MIIIVLKMRSLILAIFLLCFSIGISYSSNPTIEEIFQKHVKGLNRISNDNSDVECKACTALFGVVLEARDKNIPALLIKKFVKSICPLLVYDQRVCDGVVDPNADILFYIQNSGREIQPEKVCNLLLGCYNEFDFFNWTIVIPDKPPRIPAKISNDGDRNLRIIQLSDLHLDPRYTPGSTSNCVEPLCCQDDQGPPENPEDVCGMWGSTGSADVPKNTFYDALRHMKTQQNIDYVYFTGDIIPHRVWSTSKENNLNLEREVMELLRNTFDVPVLFVLGNHEPHPMNAYSPLNVTKNKLSNTWVFDNLAGELETLGIDDENKKNIENGGFYTIVMKPGFRIIVLNNNVCDKDNLWLLYDDYDVYGQLEWLVQVLLQAEEAGEYVHLLYHVPTGTHECLGAWGREFTRIINRFSDTIKAQFNGHTHRETFYLYYNETDPEEAISVAYNGASMTTYSNINPSYKIYDINYENYEVEEIEGWTFNLTAANLMPEKTTLDWYKLYSFKETYGVETMKPNQIWNMVVGMAKNKTLLQTHYRILYRMGKQVDTPCDDNCNEKNLCDIVTSHSDDTQHCEYIKKIYQNDT